MFYFYFEIHSFITKGIYNTNEWGQVIDSNKLGTITCLPQAGQPKQFV